MTSIQFTDRQPVAPAADVASGILPSRIDRDAGPADVAPTPSAGSLFWAAAIFGVAAMILVSGRIPIPHLERYIGIDLSNDAGRIAMGWVYLGVAGVFFLARISVPVWNALGHRIMAWARHRQWSKREVRRLVLQLSEAA